MVIILLINKLIYIKFQDNMLDNNKFNLIFDETIDG